MAEPLAVLAAADMQAPFEGGAVPYKPARIAGTGGTGDSHTTALQVNAMATLLVGATAVRVRFAATEAAAEATATTDPIIPAYGRFDWLATSSTCFVGCEAADASSAFEAHVWTSSGPRA
jgi:hypothetical protein